MILSLSGKYFLINIICIGSIVLIGYLIRRLLIGAKDLDFYNLFFNSVIGLFSLVASYAIFLTGGKTVLLGLFIIPIYYILNKKEFKCKHAQSNGVLKELRFDIIKRIATLLFGLFIITLFCLASTIDKDGIRIPHVDLLWYSSIANSLQTGSENWYQSLNFFQQNMGVSPYHYFELWAALLFSQVSGEPVLLSLVYIVNPIFSAVCLLGIASLFEFYDVKNLIIVIVVGFLLLFAGPSIWPILSKTWAGNMVGFINETSIMNNFGMKLSPLLILVLSSTLIIIIKHQYNLGLIVLSLASLLNISMIAVPMGSLVILCYLKFRKHHPYLLKKCIYFYLLGILAFLFFFYVSFSSSNVLNVKSNSFRSNFGSFLLAFKYIKSSIGYHAWVLFYFGASYALSLALIFLFRNKLKLLLAEKFLIYVFITCLFVGFGGSFVASAIPDSIQFFTNVLISLNVIIIVCFIKFISVVHRKGIFLGLYLVMFSILADNVYKSYNRRFLHTSNIAMYFSPTFIEKCSILLAYSDNPLIPVIANDSILENVGDQNVNIIMSRFSFMVTNVSQVYANDFEHPKLFATQPFVEFKKVNELVLNNAYAAFFKKYRYQICITSENSPWRPPQNWVKDFATDPISKETLYVLHEKL